MSKKNCVIGKCKKDAAARGLCASCYQAARVRILRGSLTWAELEGLGMAVASERAKAGTNGDASPGFAEELAEKRALAGTTPEPASPPCDPDADGDDDFVDPLRPPSFDYSDGTHVSAQPPAGAMEVGAAAAPGLLGAVPYDEVRKEGRTYVSTPFIDGPTPFSDALRNGKAQAVEDREITEAERADARAAVDKARAIQGENESFVKPAQTVAQELDNEPPLNPHGPQSNRSVSRQTPPAEPKLSYSGENGTGPEPNKGIGGKLLINEPLQAPNPTGEVSGPSTGPEKDQPAVQGDPAQIAEEERAERGRVAPWRR